MSIPVSTLGNGYANGVAWEVLTELVSIGDRHPGHEGEREGAATIERWFDEVGLHDVSVHQFPIPGWWRGTTKLEVGDPHHRTFDATHQLFAHPGTSSRTVTGPLVDVGYGTPEAFETTDVDGAIVLSSSSTPDGYGRRVSRMEKYVRAADAGANAFLFRTHVPGALPPTGSNAADRIPSVGVSREVGAHLERYCEGSESETRLKVESRIGEATSQNVEGTLGPETREEVLLTAHVDSHDISDGARDNGVGSALVVEVARLLAAIEPELQRRVRFVTFGAEEIGLEGARHWVDTHDLERVRCVLNVDAAGQTRTLELRSQGFERVESLVGTVTDDLGVPFDVDDSVGPGTDAWAFVQNGTPAATIASDSGGTERIEVEAGRGWGHTHADTIDKLDRRDLRDLAIQLAAIVFEIANGTDDIPRRSRAATREALDDHDEHVLRGTGRWPYE